MSEIITAAITGCVTLLGVLLSNRAAQAVTDEKLTELTRDSGVSPSLEMADREEQEWIFQHLVWQAWRRSR